MYRVFTGICVDNCIVSLHIICSETIGIMWQWNSGVVDTLQFTAVDKQYSDSQDLHLLSQNDWCSNFFWSDAHRKEFFYAQLLYFLFTARKFNIFNCSRLRSLGDAGAPSNVVYCMYGPGLRCGWCMNKMFIIRLAHRSLDLSVH